MKLLSKGRLSMELNERAKLLLAKAKDDETLLDEIILNEKIRDEPVANSIEFLFFFLL